MPQTKFLLDESDIPTQWYNVVADMPNPPLPPNQGYSKVLIQNTTPERKNHQNSQ